MSTYEDQLSVALEGRYRIERELGAGGMATVYLAGDIKHHRKVAIKVLREDLSASVGASRFLREIEIAAQLQHPNVLPLLDSGEAGGLLYYVMPYVEGQSLRQRLARERELPIGESVRILIEIVDALAYAHAHGVVHRDVKPDNVMLSGRHALVADFGVARAVSETMSQGALTAMGVALGTPAYMAPEQAVADPNVDHRADIYSVGIVAYEVLAGRPPFTGTPRQVLAAQVTEQPDPLSKYRPGVPRALEQIIMRCLEKRPADRWQNANDLLAALEPLTKTSRGYETTTARAAVSLGRSILPWATVAVSVVIATVAFIVLHGNRDSGLSVVGTAQITSESGLYLDPALSPDGRLLAYVAGPPSAMHIFVQQLGGGRVLRLTDDASAGASRLERWPQWSPDGQRIAFVSNGGIEVVPALGGVPQRLVALDHTMWASPTWSPDGRRIAYSSIDGVNAVDVATGRTSLIAKQPGRYSLVAYFDLQWSPDGRWIAASSGNMQFAFGTSGLGNVRGSGITLLGTDGRRKVTLPLDSSAMEISPVWTPDSKHLLFVSSRDGGRDVYEAAIDDDGKEGKPVRLTTGLLAHSISLARDAHTLAYASYTPAGNVWVVPLSSTGSVSMTSATQLTHGTDVIEEASVSPDGHSILITANRTGYSNLYTIPINGGPAVQITFDTTDIFNPAWSRDGREIVFHRTGDTRSYIVAASGGLPTALPLSGRTNRSDWSPDGNALVAESHVDPQAHLTIMRRTSSGWGPPRPLAGTPYSLQPAWSRDGRWIAFLANIGANLDSVGIEVIPAGGGSARILARAPASTTTVSLSRPIWSADSRAIYYRKSDPDGAVEIWKISVDGGSPLLQIRSDDPDRRPGSDASLFSVVNGNLYTPVTEHRSVLGIATLVQR